MKDRLLRVRTEEGLSQAKFAESLNLSRNYVSLMETGERKPSNRTIKDICLQYGINESWLVDGVGEMKAPESKEKKIADLVAKLYGSDENSFEFKLAMLLKDMSNDDLEKIKKFVKTLAESVD